MEKIRFYLFCIRWLWKNRTWAETRQKYRALARAWREHTGLKARLGDPSHWYDYMYLEG